MGRPSFIELAKDDPWLLACLASEEDPANRIEVPAQLSRPYSALAATLDAVAAEKRKKPRRSKSSETHAALTSSFDEPHLKLPRSSIALRVSLSSADRALLLVDTLMKTCVQRGLAISIENSHVKVAHEGHAVEVRISERVTQIIGSTKGLSKFDVLLKQHITYRPTGELTIAVKRLGSERKTTDKEGVRLEEQLGAVLIKIFRGIAERRTWFTYLEKSTADSKARAEARKAEQAAREAAAAEAKRIADDCRQKQLNLVTEATAWQQAKAIRAYADHLTAFAVQSGTPISAELRAWIEWATSTAESMDPSNKRMGFTGVNQATATSADTENFFPNCPPTLRQPAG